MNFKVKSVSVFTFLVVFFCTQISNSQNTPAPKTESSKKLFEDTTTDSDYLMSIEKASEVIETAYDDIDFSGGTRHLFADIARTQEKLNLILTNLKGSNPNVRNQQMYQVVLLEIQEELKNQSSDVDVRNQKLSKIKNRFVALRKDKTLMSLIKDTILRAKFKKELLGLKGKYVSTDSLMKHNQTVLNTKKRIIVQRKIEVSHALISIEKTLEKSGISLMGKEYPVLWNTSDRIDKKEVSKGIKAKVVIEQSVAGYYFSYSLGKLIFLTFLMGLLLWYISRNLKFLKNNNHYQNLEVFDFKYLNKSVLLAVIIIGINIAVVTNLYAPALFIELLQLILLVVLTIIFRSTWSKVALQNWLFLVGYFFVICFLDLFIEVGFCQRLAFIIINILGIRYGIVQLKTIKDQLYVKGFFKWARILFIGLNILAILFNLFGRVTISNMFSLAAFISLTYIVALSVLLKIILEIVLLQIYTTRLKRGIDKIFDYESLSNTLQKPFVIIVAYMWFVVITSNLNIWESVHSGFSRLLSRPHHIGSITFTLENVVMFFVIIWIAHLLQKYVAYFFGEIDDENEENIDKRQHSKLLVSRLIVLIVGYLLAIAASGMPLDKLSILLGALGVGVGLGLQSIVNNFVSGIILIFDKPIQIGDVIDISSESGRVKSMGLRTTKINSSSGAEIIIPNGNLLSQNITNWTYTDNLKLVEIVVEISGETTPDAINEIINETLQKVQLVNDTKAPQIYYTSISEGKFKILIKFWCSIYKTEETVSNAKQLLFSNFKSKNLTFST
jgi:potassium efflux system protein